jgi:hypothetical protein
MRVWVSQMTHLHPRRQECAVQLPPVAQIEERDRSL